MLAVLVHKHVHMFAFRAVHSSINGTTAIPWRNSRRRLPLLEQLRGCQEAWCPGVPWGREEAHAAVCGTPAGVSSPTHQIQHTTKTWFSHSLQHKVCKNVHICGLIVVHMKSITIQIRFMEHQAFIHCEFCSIFSVFDNSLNKSSSR